MERFGEENPGFNFSKAEFNGKVPMARDFMGGVKYNWGLLIDFHQEVKHQDYNIKGRNLNFIEFDVS